jgi:hypothetical protein
VSLLLAGQELKALSKLHQAVSMVKRNIVLYLHRSATNSRTLKGMGSRASDGRTLELSGVSTEMTLEQLHQDSVQLPASGLANLQCYVYNRAFRISEENLPNSTMENTAQIGSAIIIFNMALLLHRACLLYNRSVPASKPLDLYKIVLQLLESLTGSPTTCDSPSLLQGVAGAIQLATLNNMAQLQFEMGESSHAIHGFDYLANLMTTIQRAPLGASEMRGIIINILYRKKVVMFAPAA